MKTRENSIERNRCVRVVNVVTSSLSVRFVTGQTEYLRKKGFRIFIVSSPGEELRNVQSDGVHTVELPMTREISPWRDLLSLWRLLRVISHLSPDIVNVATPKAGLLGGLAAWVCRVRCRYYTLHGLRCETTTGVKRRVLLLAERITCACAHKVICVSESLRQKAIDLGVVHPDRAVVLAAGSCAGVDTMRFVPTGEVLLRAERIRQQLGIPAKAPVAGFVGRLTKDKGIEELVEAFSRLRANFPEIRLLLVGDAEEGDPLPPRIRRCLACEPGIICTGFVQDPADYYHVMDVVVLPSRREGFPTVVLEAHAAGKPVVATSATGIRDAVVDGVTGILVRVGDAQALASALASVIQDRNFAAGLGSAGRERVLNRFQQEVVWDALAREYLQLVQAKGLTVPTVNPNDDRAVLTDAVLASR